MSCGRCQGVIGSEVYYAKAERGTLYHRDCASDRNWSVNPNFSWKAAAWKMVKNVEKVVGPLIPIIGVGGYLVKQWMPKGMFEGVASVMIPHSASALLDVIDRTVESELLTPQRHYYLTLLVGTVACFYTPPQNSLETVYMTGGMVGGLFLSNLSLTRNHHLLNPDATLEKLGEILKASLNSTTLVAGIPGGLLLFNGSEELPILSRLMRVGTGFSISSSVATIMSLALLHILNQRQ